MKYKPNLADQLILKNRKRSQWEKTVKHYHFFVEQVRLSLGMQPLRPSPQIYIKHKFFISGNDRLRIWRERSEVAYDSGCFHIIRVELTFQTFGPYQVNVIDYKYSRFSWKVWACVKLLLRLLTILNKKKPKSRILNGSLKNDINYY